MSIFGFRGTYSDLFDGSYEGMDGGILWYWAIGFSIEVGLLWGVVVWGSLRG